MKIKNYRAASDIICSLLLFLFLYTGISKFSELRSFTVTLKDSLLLRPYATLLAPGIPATEILIVLLLFFPVTRLIGLYFSAILLLVFTAYLIYMIGFTTDRPCCCGGIISAMSWSQHIAFNIFSLIVSIAGILLTRRSGKIEGPP